MQCIHNASTLASSHALPWAGEDAVPGNAAPPARPASPWPYGPSRRAQAGALPGALQSTGMGHENARRSFVEGAVSLGSIIRRRAPTRWRQPRWQARCVREVTRRDSERVSSEDRQICAPLVASLRPFDRRGCSQGRLRPSSRPSRSAPPLGPPFLLVLSLAVLCLTRRAVCVLLHATAKRS